MPLAPSFDSVGGLAKTVQDLAEITGVLLRRPELSTHLTRSWASMRVGFVDPKLWQPAPIAVEPHEDFLNQTASSMRRRPISARSQTDRLGCSTADGNGRSTRID